MTTETPAFDYDPEKIITFPRGIPGLEEYTRYVLVRSDAPESHLYWLEAVDSSAIQFAVVDPTVYSLNYTLDLNDDEQALLQSDDPNDIQVFLMLSRKVNPENDGSSINANIAGPILINTKTRLGMQKILVRSRVEVHIIEDQLPSYLQPSLFADNVGS